MNPPEEFQVYYLPLRRWVWVQRIPEPPTEAADLAERWAKAARAWWKSVSKPQ